MTVQVECYAGFQAAERPVRFKLNGQDHEVEEVLDQWYSPYAKFFRVRSNDGNVYILRHDESPQNDTWTLESFRRVETHS